MTQVEAATSRRSARRRPALVTWLCLGVVTLAGVQAVGFLGSLQLPDLPYAAPRAYFAARSGLWALWGFVTAWGAFRGRPWGRPLLAGGGAALAIWYWVDQSWLAQSDFSRLAVPLRAVATVLLLGAGLWILSRPDVRRFFEENRR